MSPRGTVLVIGATGLVGSHLAAELSGAGQRVLGTSTDGAGSDLACDLLRPETIEAAIRQARPETIVITAGQSSARRAWSDPTATFGLNTGGTASLLEAARRRAPEAHLVLASSGAAYGHAGNRAPDRGRAKRGSAGAGTAGQDTTGTGPTAEDDFRPLVETDRLRPASPYGASKAAAEALCNQYGRAYGVRITVARLFNQVGPGQPPSQAPSEFAREIALAERAGAGEAKLELASPGVELDCTDARDTARALTEMIERGLPGTFNVCSGRAVRLDRIAASLASSTGLEVEIAVEPERARSTGPTTPVGSSLKLREATGWRPLIPLDRSLCDLLEDWRARTLRE